MKIISYNLNGIRAALNKGLEAWIKNEQPDILCFQEIKAQPEQINDDIFKHINYYTCWNSATKKGYSGTGIISKILPDRISFGLGNKKYDDEGRIIRFDFKDITLINVYVPSGAMGEARIQFKLEFLDDFLHFINNLKKQRPNLIVSGDFNICHKEIDIHHPEQHTNVSGFLPEERAWLNKFIDSGFIDSFRYFNNQPNYYTWWSYRMDAREKNLGWRIDYHFVTHTLKNKLKNASILTNTFHSDHCPVLLELN